MLWIESLIYDESLEERPSENWQTEGVGGSSGEEDIIVDWKYFKVPVPRKRKKYSCFIFSFLSLLEVISKPFALQSNWWLDIFS